MNRRRITMIAALLCFWGAVFAQNTQKVKEPDFAYPRTVIADAEKQLKACRKAGDAVGELRALMQIAQADGLVDKGLRQQDIKAALSFANSRNDKQMRALGQLYAARLIGDFYGSNQWKFNRRDLPLTPRPADMDAWSGEQFRTVIDSLCREAVAAAGDMPITELDRVVEYDDLSVRYFPTLSDFAIVASLSTTGLSDSLAVRLQREALAKTTPGSLPYYYFLGAKMRRDCVEPIEYAKAFLAASDRRNALVLWQFAEPLYNWNSGDKDLEMFREALTAAQAVSRSTWAENMIDELADKFYRKSLTLSMPTYVPADYPVHIVVSRICNVDSFTLTAYRVTADKWKRLTKLSHESVTSKKIKASSLSVVRHTYALSDREKDTVTVTLPAGYYIFKTSVAGVELDDYAQTVSTNVAAFDFTSDKTHGIIVRDFISGSPVQGATVKLYGNNNKKGNILSASGTTDRRGVAALPSESRGYVEVTYKGVTTRFYDLYLNKQVYRPYRPSDDVSLSFTTSQGVYRLSDTVRWVALAGARQGVVDNLAVRVYMRDSQDNVLDSADVVTDAFGRAAGAFALPAQGRTGSFALTVRSVSKINRRVSGRGTFQVSDFRLAGIKMTEVIAWPNKDGKSPNLLTVSGMVSDYSGTPVANATVNAVLNWHKGNKTEGAVTGIDGRFVFNDTIPVDSTFYNVSLEAIAPDGTVCNADVSGMMQYPNRIVLSCRGDAGEIDRNIDLSKPYRFRTGVLNPAGDSVHVVLTCKIFRPVEYYSKADAVVLARFKVESDDTFTLPAELNLPIGSYCISLETDGANSTQSYYTFYNSKLKVLPDADDLFWMPNDSIIGVSEPGLDFTYSFIGPDKEPHINNVHLDAGYYDVSSVFDMSGVSAGSKKAVGNKKTIQTDDYETISGDKLTILAVRDGKSQSNEIFVRRPAEQMRVCIDTFRDKVVSGTDEKWTVRVTDAAGKPADAALVLSVYDARMDLLYSPNNLRVNRPLPYRPQIIVDNNRTLYYRRFNFRSSLKQFSDILQVSPPVWRYLTLDYYDGGIMPRRMNSKQIYGSRMPGVESIAMSDAQNVQYEKVEASSAKEYELAEDVSVSAAGVDVNIPVKFHDNDAFSALWMPLLNAADGKADVSFRVPNSNTTWTVRGFAWTKSGDMCTLTKSFTSAKPLMVKLNAPRFVRTGDRVVTLATVTNASPETRTVTVTLDNSAVVGADTLAAVSTTRTLTVAAGDNVTLPIEVVVPGDASHLLLTVIARDGDMSDGERISVPVLPSQSRVTETQNFYMNPGQTTESLTVPADKGRDFVSSLSFTGNPMWTVVDALQNIKVNKASTTVDGQVRLYFSASVILGLMERHPELELQFSKKQMRSVADNALRELQKLQLPDGSFLWGPWCNFGSKYTTENVLDVLATLQRTGYLHDKAAIELAAKACRYLDNAVDAKYIDVDYTVMRPAFSQVPQSVNGRAVTAKTVQHILKNWKNATIEQKAIWACALWYNDNAKMAHKLMGSLDQFGTLTETKGFEFRNVHRLTAYAWLLRAYGSVTPKSERVDGLRQYLIVRRQGEAWGNSDLTVRIVRSMIESGTPWTTEAGNVTVSIDGKSQDIAAADRQGSFTIPVDGKNVVLTRVDKADTPAYGALITEYTAQNKDISAYSDGEVRITKQLFVQKADGSWESFNPGTQSLTVGQRVRTQLTITSDRVMSNVTVVDDRAATLEPVNQLSGWVFSEVLVYRENRDAATNLYIETLRKGTFLIQYDFNVNNAGEFATGVATVTCTQAPTLTAHSAGTVLRVSPAK